jgi:hypothetical protein
LNGILQQVCIAAAFFSIPIESLEPFHFKISQQNFLVSVCGDDMLAGSKVPLLPEFYLKLKANYARFGFEAKLHHSNTFEHAVFLGSRPVHTGSGWFWGRTIGRAAYKLGWTDPDGDIGARVAGTARQLTITNPHVPILQDLAEAVLRCREGLKINDITVDDELYEAHWRYNTTPGRYDRQALLSTVRAYTPENSSPLFTVDELVDCIDKIRQISRVPAIFEHPVLDAILSYDDL